MDFKPLDIKVWSKLGQRGTFGTVLTKLAEENEKIIALTADLTSTSGLEHFSQRYPDRFLNVGIAEQNLVGVAAGIADANGIPFAATFANFISLRACEQMRHFLGYMNCNVKMVGLSAGFGMELFGCTHYGIEDIATLRSIPNIVILSPADGLEVMKCVEVAALYSGPVYIRLTGVLNQAIVYTEDYEFQIGKTVEVAAYGTDIIIYATGSMVALAKEAAKLLEQENIRCTVLNMHTIKPIDKKVIDKYRFAKLLVTIEEHSIIGGLGSAVAEILSEYGSHAPLLKLGINGAYKKAGSYEYMLEQHGLTVSKIADELMLYMKGMKK